MNRPPLITAICILGMIGAVAAVPVILGIIGSHDINRPYYGFSATVGLISFIGFWYMKRWGLYLYFAMLLLNQAMMIFVFQSWSIASLINPVIVILAGILYYDRMS